MARNVFILGAEASKEVGAPLMNNFLEVAEGLLRSNQVEDFRYEFELVFEGRSALMQTHSKSLAIDIYNMEAVFSAFEMGKMLGRLGRMDADKVTTSSAYSSLVEFSNDINEISHGNSTFITFNYDLALDHALYRKSKKSIIVL